ncbi:DUF4394 domain-containing protein [Larkinella rosea]|nr:DUF4394 domain-containing protein [Larkinella rosea]
MKIVHTLSFHTLRFCLLVSFVIQSCDDHRIPTDPSNLPGLPTSVFYALADNNTVYEMDMREPTKMGNPVGITTLEPDEKLIAIDFRPATGQLFALSDRNVFYTVYIDLNRPSRPSVPLNPQSAVKAPAVVPIYGFDFNPVTDQMRVVSNSGENLLLDPRTGLVDPKTGKASGGATPYVGGIAYSNNYSGATNTTLYGIDTKDDKLVRYENADASAVQAVGDLGADIDEVGGFDISPKSYRSQGREYGIASIRRGNAWELDYVDLATGKLHKLGDLPTGKKILGIAFPTPVAYGLTSDHKLLAFNPVTFTFTKGYIHEKPITGLPQGVSLLGLDFSVEVAPKLVALGSNSTTYEINTVTGTATELYKMKNYSLDLTGNPAFGLDFEPYSNKLYVVSSDRKNYYAINLSLQGSTALVPAFTLNGNPQGLDAIAFSSNYQNMANADNTELFGIDSETGTLYKKSQLTSALTKLGVFAGKMDKMNGFDIGGYIESGYGLMTVDGASRFFIVSTGNGASVSVPFPYANVSGFTLGQNLYNMVP